MASKEPETDPLRELEVDASAVDRQALATALKGTVGIDMDSGRLSLLGGYFTLDALQKVATVLLAQKAAFLLERVVKEEIASKRVTDESGLPPGTVAPMLKKLREKRLVGQGVNKAYYIPNAQVTRVIGLIAEEANND